MTTMIERVARAIAKREEKSEQRWACFMDHARAAIQAMRKPTDFMVSMGDGARGNHLRDYPNDTRGMFWAMIDAALAEEPK